MANATRFRLADSFLTRAAELTEGIVEPRRLTLRPDVIRPGLIRPSPRPGIPGVVPPRQPLRPLPIPPLQPTLIPPPEVPPQPPPSPQPTVPAQPATPPPMPLPEPPAGNPFAALPFPSPGDRIKSDDFKRLSQCLRILYDTYVLSGALFGRLFGEARAALTVQQYEVVRVISVFGAELTGAGDPSLDSRKVLQVAPLTLGEKQVIVVVSEAADTRRYMPDLTGKTYRQAMEIVQTQLGDVLSQGGPLSVPQLVGMTVTEAERTVSG